MPSTNLDEVVDDGWYLIDYAKSNITSSSNLSQFKSNYFSGIFEVRHFGRRIIQRLNSSGGEMIIRFNFGYGWSEYWMNPMYGNGLENMKFKQIEYTIPTIVINDWITIGNIPSSMTTGNTPYILGIKLIRSSDTICDLSSEITGQRIQSGKLSLVFKNTSYQGLKIQVLYAQI